MTITAHKVLSYTIEDHPNPDLVYDWIRSNWDDLGQHSVDGCMDSLKGFCTAFGLDLNNWAISLVPDYGEFVDIGISSDLEELADIRLYKYIVNNYDEYLKGDCPFTGVCYDENLLDPIRDFLKKPTVSQGYTWQDLVNDCANSLLECLHREGEYIYSDEGLKDMCEANDYEFAENGSIY